MSQSGKNRVKLLQMMSKMLILERLDIVTGNRWQHLPRRTQPNSNPKPNLNLNKKKGRNKNKRKKRKRIFSRSPCLLTRPLSDPAGYPVKSRRIRLLLLLLLLFAFFLFSTFGADKTFIFVFIFFFFFFFFFFELAILSHADRFTDLTPDRKKYYLTCQHNIGYDNATFEIGATAGTIEFPVDLYSWLVKCFSNVLQCWSILYKCPINSCSCLPIWFGFFTNIWPCTEILFDFFFFFSFKDFLSFLRALGLCLSCLKKKTFRILFDFITTSMDSLGILADLNRFWGIL